MGQPYLEYIIEVDLALTLRFNHHHAILLWWIFELLTSNYYLYSIYFFFWLHFHTELLHHQTFIFTEWLGKFVQGQVRYLVLIPPLFFYGLAANWLNLSMLDVPCWKVLLGLLMVIIVFSLEERQSFIVTFFFSTLKTQWIFLLTPLGIMN